MHVKKSVLSSYVTSENSPCCHRTVIGKSSLFGYLSRKSKSSLRILSSCDPLFNLLLRPLTGTGRTGLSEVHLVGGGNPKKDICAREGLKNELPQLPNLATTPKYIARNL